MAAPVLLIANLSLRAGMLNKNSTRRKLTRKEQRDLDIEISFMEGVVQRDPKFADAWRVLSDDYSRRGKLDEGLKADEQLARMQPDDADTLYNLACGYALRKNIDQAIAALTQSVAKGFCDFKWMLKDPDLSNLRKDPLFKKLWSKISTLQPDTP
jgi:tetratricopeptide (TPR) repeat protein